MINKPEDIQKWRVKVAYLWGLGLGIVITALQLTPKTSVSGDKYMMMTVFGATVIVAAAVLTWYVRRREIAHLRTNNLTELRDK